MPAGQLYHGYLSQKIVNVLCLWPVDKNFVIFIWYYGYNLNGKYYIINIFNIDKIFKIDSSLINPLKPRVR